VWRFNYLIKQIKTCVVIWCKLSSRNPLRIVSPPNSRSRPTSWETTLWGFLFKVYERLKRPEREFDHAHASNGNISPLSLAFYCWRLKLMKLAIYFTCGVRWPNEKGYENWILNAISGSFRWGGGQRGTTAVVVWFAGHACKDTIGSFPSRPNYRAASTNYILKMWQWAPIW
jgi:hypothetical protein